jgi:hypothetical protein
VYDRLDLLGPGNEAEVLKDLRARTKLPVARYDIVRLDLMRDTAELTIHYPPAIRPGTLSAAS